MISFAGACLYEAFDPALGRLVETCNMKSHDTFLRAMLRIQLRVRTVVEKLLRQCTCQDFSEPSYKLGELAAVQPLPIHLVLHDHQTSMQTAE